MTRSRVVEKLPLLAGLLTMGWSTAAFVTDVLHPGFEQSIRTSGFEAFLGASENRMAPLSAFGFLCMGFGVVVRTAWRTGQSKVRFAFLLLSGFAALICLFILGALASGVLQATSGTSPATTTLYLLTAGAFAGGWQLSPTKWTINLSCSLAVAVMLFSGTLAVAYWYRVPLFYSGPFSPPALPSVLTFLLINSGLFLILAPETTLFAFLFRRTLLSRLVRSLVPAVVSFILLDGWVDSWGLFSALNPAVSRAIQSLGLAIVATLIVLFQSRRITRAFAQTSMKLKESEQRFQIMVEQIGDGFELLDSSGRFLDVNEAICRILGYERAELLSLSVPEIDPATSAERYSQFFTSLIGQAPKTFETQHQRKDGALLNVEITASVLTMNAQPQLIAMVRDRTDQKKAEERLRESEYFFKETQRVANIGSYKLDFQTRRWESSKTLDHLFGLESGPARTFESWLALVHPDDREELVGHIRNEVVVQHRPYNKVYRIVRADDAQERWVHALGELKINDSGQVLSMMGTIQDITEKRRSEEAVQRSQRLDSLGVLAGGIAHDFNNLLAGIFGNVDLALQKSRQSEISKYLERAHKTLDRARGLTSQLLTFAKGGTPIMEDAFLTPFLVETARFALSGSNGSSEFDLPADLWPCRFDKTQLGQLIDNLVINAQQSMPTGGVVRVSARNVTLKAGERGVSLDGRYVRISVSDEGIGIPAELLPRIFDPFFTTKSHGHGLGLATCYSIAKRHGGSVDVESEMGTGSTFHVFLPAVDQAKQAPPANTMQHRGEGRFLVMDDEPVVQETLEALLEYFGYSVVSLSDGQAAVELVARETAAGGNFVGMILDLTVAGGMGGREAVGALRSYYPELPIFVTSGYAEDRVIADPTRFGFTASLRKPFDQGDLAKLLSQHMPQSE